MKDNDKLREELYDLICKFQVETEEDHYEVAKITSDVLSEHLRSDTRTTENGNKILNTYNDCDILYANVEKMKVNPQEYLDNDYNMDLKDWFITEIKDIFMYAITHPKNYKYYREMNPEDFVALEKNVDNFLERFINALPSTVKNASHISGSLSKEVKRLIVRLLNIMDENYTF